MTIGIMAAERQRAGSLDELVAPIAFCEDAAVLTKRGEVFRVLQLAGLDSECLDDGQLATFTARVASVVRALGPEFRMYQYLVRRQRPDIGPAPRDAISARRERWLQSRDLYSVELFLALVHAGDGPAASGIAALAPHRAARIEVAKLRASLDALERASLTVSREWRDAIHPRRLSRRETLSFLRMFLNLDPALSEAHAEPRAANLDTQMARSSVERFERHLRINGQSLRVMSLAEAPPATHAHQLRGLLKIQCNIVAVTEWRQAKNSEVLRAIGTGRKHSRSGVSTTVNIMKKETPGITDALLDGSKIDMVREFDKIKSKLELEDNHFGRFSLTVGLWHADEQELARACSSVAEVFDTQDSKIIEETVNIVPAWIGMVPGSSGVGGREMWLLDDNYADMSLMFAPSAGSPWNEHLNARSLAVVETRELAPYHVNLHYQDVGHTAIFGGTGSGKTFLTNVLVAGYQQYAPYTFVFDVGGGYTNLIRHYGGDCLRPASPSAPRMNPFACEKSAENHEFQFTFVRALIERQGRVLDPEERKDLDRALADLAEVEPQYRTMSQLVKLCGRSYRPALEEWTNARRLGRFFDSAVDEFEIGRIQAFDFEGLEDSEALEAIMFYVLHRASATVRNPQLAAVPKLFVMDEAWRFFKTQASREYVVEALKTWRKKNGAVWIVTQSGEDLKRGGITADVTELCLNKIFVAHPNVDVEVYRKIFGLNEREAELVTKLAPQGEFLLSSPAGAKVLRMVVDPETMAVITGR